MRIALPLTATALLLLAGCGGSDSSTDGQAGATDNAADRMERTEEMHRLIDLGFEGCQWDIRDNDSGTIISGCEEHHLFTVVSDSEAGTLNVMEAMADEGPGTMYYAIEGGDGVLAADAGDRNLAQDLLGGGALDSGSF